MRLGAHRRATVAIAICFAGMIAAKAVGHYVREPIGWVVLLTEGDDTIYGPHSGTELVASMFRVAIALILVGAIATSWGKAAQASVRLGVRIGFLTGLAAGLLLRWLAHPLGADRGGWTRAELSYQTSQVIGPLMDAFTPAFQFVGLTAMSILGPAIAWAIYGSLVGLGYHALARRYVVSRAPAP